MDYRKGSIGRIFIARVDHGEDLLAELSSLALKEEIVSAFFIILGGLEKAEFVTGPKESVVPPVEIWSAFGDGHQIVGAGNIFWENGTPKIHLHGVTGSTKEITMGCIRKTASTFMYLDVFIIETDILAKRVFDKNLGASPIRFQ
jgi:uncharacterized protein